VEAWLEIFEFPGYSVSNYGRVRNDYTNHILTLLRNQNGTTHVGMSRGGVQYKRSVAKLVAERFLQHITLDDFSTPIHLNGDRTNNTVSNLAWRPKWFADTYTRQWNALDARVRKPIRDKDTGEVYEDSTHVAKTHGLLERDIVESISTGVKVFPTFQRFEIAS
jgi:hypothetical protein